MIPLINKSDLDLYKFVADSVRNITTWEQFVIESQILDIKKWLGDALLHELVTQASTSPQSISAANQRLLDGDTYIYSGCTYMFTGLKACIIYYAFGRFTNRNPYNYTAAGVVIKDSDFSTPASDKHIQRLETEARLTAEAFRDEVILFLNRNYQDYPLWKCRCCVAPGRTATFRVVGE